MKYDMDNGMWWGLIKNGDLVALKRSSIEPASFDFGYYFSTEHTYEVIPVKIIPETY